MLKKMAALMAAGLLTGSCSFLFQDGVPSHWNRRSDPRCSESVILPVIDTVLGALDVLGTLYGSGSGAIVTGAVAALELASAVSGYSSASECSAAYRTYERHQAKAAKDDDDLTDDQRDEIEELKRSRQKRIERDRRDLERLRREESERLEAEEAREHDAPVDAGMPLDEIVADGGA